MSHVLSDTPQPNTSVSPPGCAGVISKIKTSQLKVTPVGSQNLSVFWEVPHRPGVRRRDPVPPRVLPFPAQAQALLQDSWEAPGGQALVSEGNFPNFCPCFQLRTSRRKPGVLPVNHVGCPILASPQATAQSGHPLPTCSPVSRKRGGGWAAPGLLRRPPPGHQGARALVQSLSGLPVSP